MKTERKRKKGAVRLRLSWVDWVLLLLALSVFCLAGYLILQRRDAALPTETVQYTLCVSGVRKQFLDEPGWEALFPVGMAVTSANATADLGRIIAVEKRPTRVCSVLNAKLIWADALDREDLFITVKGRGVCKSGDGIRLSDIRIAAGERGSFRIGNYYAEQATVISVIRGD